MGKILRPVTPNRASNALTELFKFPERREIASKILLFFAEKGLSQRPYSNHGVATELTLAFYRVPTDSLLSYDAFNALARRSQCVHCASTTSALRCRDFPTVRSFGQGPVELGK